MLYYPTAEMPVGVTNGGGCFLLFFGGSQNLFSFLLIWEGGGTMSYITWNDLVQIALLIVAILSCFYSKKR